MRRSPRIRLLFLGALNALIVVHVVLYYAYDRTSIGCVDFFGLATFLGAGEITAGTLFLGGVLLLTLVLGRVFCGWGCHFALFQDLLVRLFGRFGIQAPFRRSRLELVIPPILFLVTLAYPIIAWWRNHGRPADINLNLAYPEVWHLLPGWKGVLLILLVDVVLLTVLFGSRAFCRYVCPYGLLLKAFHALSPVRVVKASACSDCGECARACPTGVPIKFETENFGVIRDLNCMNCGDCVAACPDGALAIRPTKLAYRHGRARIATRIGQPLWADLVLLLVAIAGLIFYRGREFGDFLSVGLGLVAGALVLAALRPSLFVRARWRANIRHVRVSAAVVGVYLVLGIVGQGVTSHFLQRAQTAFEQQDYPATYRALAAGRRAADVLGWSTFYLDNFNARAKRTAGQLLKKADEQMQLAHWSDAEWLFRSIVAADPMLIRAYGDLGTSLMKQGRNWEAAQWYLKVLEFDPNDLVALYHLAMAWIQLGNLDSAVNLVEKILGIDTVGNAHSLIAENPLFHLLDNHPAYRRAMLQYRPRARESGSNWREQ